MIRLLMKSLYSYMIYANSRLDIQYVFYKLM